MTSWYEPPRKPRPSDGVASYIAWVIACAAVLTAVTALHGGVGW